MKTYRFTAASVLVEIGDYIDVTGQQADTLPLTVFDADTGAEYRVTGVDSESGELQISVTRWSGRLEADQ